jgi:UDP-glucose 6-dehydrogenase
MCERFNINWENVVEIAEGDARLGHTHWRVPGPDGKRGFGGACFPKDAAALLNMAHESKIEMTMLLTATKTNDRLRKE